MRESGFEDLADLWQDGEEGDREVFEVMARRARRRGRLLGYADLGLFVVLVGSILSSVFMTPNPTTLVTAILLLVVTVWLSLTRRRLRQMSATLDTSDPATFLESSVANAKANLRRVNLSLMVIPPIVAMAAVFKGSQRSNGVIEDLPRGIWEWASSGRAMIALTVIFLIFLSVVWSRRRLRAVLSRLESLRQDYEEESRRDVGID
ncbi:MAG TPA: hypothetical protein VE053_02235 [Allosphingosinicella sp.]|nr:hypothetical protein [Allosphingosinicella sp.]